MLAVHLDQISTQNALKIEIYVSQRVHFQKPATNHLVSASTPRPQESHTATTGGEPYETSTYGGEWRGAVVQYLEGRHLAVSRRQLTFLLDSEPGRG
jgi:hypothetical protein